MVIGWLTDDRYHMQHWASDVENGVVRLDLRDGCPPDVDVLVIYANVGLGQRSRRFGLRWLESRRRNDRCRVPALVYSFESRERLAEEYALLAAGVPGTHFERLPLNVMDLAERLYQVSEAGWLSQEELSLLLRWHCGWSREWSAWAHRLRNMIHRLPESLGELRACVAEMQTCIIEVALDVEDLYLDLTCSAEDGDTDEITGDLEALLDALCGRSGSVIDTVTAPPRRPPPGFETILVADDGDYPAETLIKLKMLGYEPLGLAHTLEDARRLASQFRPGIVLADCHFPTASDGRVLMEFAKGLPWGPIVIAISRASFSDDTLPSNVGNCCGPKRFQSADSIHALVWSRYSARREAVHVPE